MSELIKDIICFANTAHSENCYLIFGVDNDYEVVGMQKTRYELANILDALSKLEYANSEIPEIKLDTVALNDEEIDILTVMNTDNTPIYFWKQYGKMY